MLIEYYRKRNARLKGDICFYNGKGRNIILALRQPQEIEDQWGYMLLAENADIIRLVEKAPPPVPMPSEGEPLRKSPEPYAKPKKQKKKSKN